MKTLKLQLPNNRAYAGTLSMGDGSTSVTAVGTCDSDFEGYEPKPGSYKLKQINLNKQATNEELYAAYGPAVLVFEAVSGGAMRFSNTPDGRNILAIHAGETDDSDNLLPTNGSIRVSNGDMIDLLNYIGRDKVVSLDLEEKKLGILGRMVAPLVAAKASKEAFIAPSSSHHDDNSSSSFNPWFWLWVYDSMSSSNRHVYQDVSGFYPGDGRSGGGGANESLDSVGATLPLRDEHASAEVVAAVADPVVASLPIIADPFTNDAGTNQPPAAEVSGPITEATEAPADSDRSGFTSEPEHGSSY